MQECEYIDTCKLFSDENTSRMPKLVDMFKNKFCTADFKLCARYQVASNIGREHVPLLLIPPQIDWAWQIISEIQPEIQSTETKKETFQAGTKET